MTAMTPADHRAYLLAEMRAAAVRAKLWQSDITAVALALKGGAITAEQALELLAARDALCLIGTAAEEPR